MQSWGQLRVDWPKWMRWVWAERRGGARGRVRIGAGRVDGALRHEIWGGTAFHVGALGHVGRSGPTSVIARGVIARGVIVWGKVTRRVARRGVGVDQTKTC